MEFPTVNKSITEKADPSCIDKFNYTHFKAGDDTIELNQMLLDSGCKAYNISKNITYMKCPQRNCKMKTTYYEEMQTGVIKDLSVNQIDLKYN